MHMYKRRIHFIGIGGAGMSALAEIMAENGQTVTGSDCAKTRITEQIESMGIGIQYDHEPKLIADCDMAVYSSAVKEDNPERVYARDNRIPCMRRAEMLGELMRTKFSIGIAGTHGKTTTTSLIGHVLTVAGRAPTIIVGGTMRGRGRNATVGSGDILVAEADEYDRSFLAMYPSIAVITNIEADHLDCYKDIDDIKQAFVQYANAVPFYGAVVVCSDDVHAREILPHIGKTVVTYGIDECAEYRGEEIGGNKANTTFRVVHKKKAMGMVTVPLMGLHNVRNCLAAIAVCSEMGVTFDEVREGLSRFSGIRRRFEQVGFENGITVIDDYAHHPSEIAATLSAARSCKFKKVIAVFQPHLYTRTRDFINEFAQSLSSADIAVVTHIYKAREKHMPGISAEQITQRMTEIGHVEAQYIENRDDACMLAAQRAEKGDCVILMGAGDIGESAPLLCERLRDG